MCQISHILEKFGRDHGKNLGIPKSFYHCSKKVDSVLENSLWEIWVKNVGNCTSSLLGVHLISGIAQHTAGNHHFVSV